MTDKPQVLKQCPFCGCDSKLVDERTIFGVECTNQECRALVLGDRAPEPDGNEPVGYWGKLAQSAVDRWNKRVNKDIL